MADNSSTDPATADNDTFTGTVSDDSLTGGLGSDTLTGDAGNDVLHGDSGPTSSWHYEAYDYDFSSDDGQAFDIENGTQVNSGYVTDFNESDLINSVRGSTSNPSDFGIIYTSTLNITSGGTYTFATTSDDGSTLQIFDSNGNPVEFTNQNGTTGDFLNNDFHQGTTTRTGTVSLDPNETYTIQIRYWENAGQDNLASTISGPDTGNVTESLIGNSLIGPPPGPDFSVTGASNGVQGDDVIDGGAGNDSIVGDGGHDTLTGGLDDDTISGGEGNDTFIFNAGDGDDVITDFNTGTGQDINDGDQTNNDFLDLSAFYTNLSEVRDDLADNGVLDQSTGDFSDNTALGGSITFTGVAGSELTEDNINVACFVRGTAIATQRGDVLVEDLKPEDMIVTMDHGLQFFECVLSTKVKATGRLAPVVISKGALGNSRDLRVSPQHRMLFSDWRAELLFGEAEVLVAAHSLVNGDTIYREEGAEVEYFHIVMERHEVIYAEGCPTESFYVCDNSVAGLNCDTRAEVLALFPELKTDSAYKVEMARPFVASYEMKSLMAVS